MKSKPTYQELEKEIAILRKEKPEKSKLQLQERNKELEGIYSLGLITEKYENPDDIYTEFVNVIVPESMQFSDKVFVSLEIDTQKYCNIENYNQPKDRKYLSAKINLFKKQIGRLIVTHIEDLPFIEIFEQKLINAYAERISKITERIKAEKELKQQNEEYSKLNEAYKITNEKRKIAKEKAEKSEEQFRQLFENMEQGFALHEMIYDKNNNPIDYRFIILNDAFEKLTGLKKVNLIGKTVKEIMSNTEQLWIDNYGKVAKTGIPYHFENYSQELDKHYNVVAYSPRKDFFAVIFSDVTQIKEFQNEIIKAKENAEESDQLKTEFINNMSHEIRTPMNAILGFSGFLNNSNLTNEKRKHYTSIIQSSGNQLLQIIDDILEISQLGTKQVKISEKEICLNDLFLELFSIFDIKAKENKTPLYLNKGLSDNESVILTDETKLNKILNNLLENALKFTNEGFIEFGYKIKNEEIEIYVKVTGIGIKPESQKIIFDRFSQEEKGLSRKVGGLGLGLSIAKENAELLSGKITLKSEKRKGAIFYVTIPYKPVNHKHKNDNSNTDKTRTTKKQDKYTILIVEDEEVNYLYIDTLLEDFELNLRTLHAKHGKEAVEMCKEKTEIDFVLMDMKMPIMNGFEATKLIKKFRPNLPIVAQTAYSTRDEKEQAFTAGCDDFISKPISEETLSGIINKYLIASK